MVLGEPEGVVARPVHQLGESAGFVEDSDEVLVGFDAVVDRQALEAQTVHLDMAAEEGVEVLEHGSSFQRQVIVSR